MKNVSAGSENAERSALHVFHRVWFVAGALGAAALGAPASNFTKQRASCATLSLPSRSADRRDYVAARFFSRCAYCLRNLETFGATTNMQYGCPGLFSK